MKHISFFNISPIQFFDITPDDDIDHIDDIDDSQDQVIDKLEPLKDIDTSEINLECFDDRNSSQILDIAPSICPNIPQIPTGRRDGVIGKIPVVLAQLVIPLDITSSIDLPEEAFEIKDIENRLQLRECILLQPTNILFVKGFINKSIDYSILESFSPEEVYGKLKNYQIDIPFECSTAVKFFTNPLDPISNTREIFQYGDINLSKFNQVSKEFFNEIPFCKLLSSQIVDFDRFIQSKDSVHIQETMHVEIKIEVLQNQPIVIASSSNSSLKID